MSGSNNQSGVSPAGYSPPSATEYPGPQGRTHYTRWELSLFFLVQQCHSTRVIITIAITCNFSANSNSVNDFFCWMLLFTHRNQRCFSLLTYEITEAMQILNRQLCQWIVMYSWTNLPFIVYKNIIKFWCLQSDFSPLGTTQNWLNMDSIL